jgi:nucleoside-diphosphate-sugar epimerase
MIKKVLVTGGCGYIGSIIVPMLLENNYKVRVLDKLYFGDESLAEVRGKIEFIAGDVRELKDKVLEGIDAVIHLGSLSNDPTADFDPLATQDINYNGTVRLARACKERGISHFTFASTAAVYGFHLSGLADESLSPKPQSVYAQSKYDAELSLQQLADDTFCPVILRQATAFGFSPRMRWDIVVNAFVMHAFKTGQLDIWYGGEAWRPFVHVKDIARAHIRCLEAQPSEVCGQTFNLVYGNYRIIDLAQQVKKALSEIELDVSIKVDYRQVDNRSYQVNGKKIKKTLQFTPSISIAEGVKEIAQVLTQGKYRDFDHPVYYNLPWMKLLIEIEDRIKRTGKVL